MKIKKGSVKCFKSAIFFGVIMFLALINIFEIGRTINFYLFTTFLTIATIAFFGIIVIQIPIDAFTKFYLYNGLSEKDYRLSQRRCERDFCWIEMDLYSTEELESNLDKVKKVLKKHKLCSLFYFHLWLQV